MLVGTWGAVTALINPLRWCQWDRDLQKPQVRSASASSHRGQRSLLGNGLPSFPFLSTNAQPFPFPWVMVPDALQESIMPGVPDFTCDGAACFAYGVLSQVAKGIHDTYTILKQVWDSVSPHPGDLYIGVGSEGARVLVQHNECEISVKASTNIQFPARAARESWDPWRTGALQGFQVQGLNRTAVIKDTERGTWPEKGSLTWNRTV